MLARMRLWQLQIVMLALLAVGIFAFSSLPGLMKPKAVRNACAQEVMRSADPLDIANQVCRH
jgi:hypothetical protein